MNDAATLDRLADLVAELDRVAFGLSRKTPAQRAVIATIDRLAPEILAVVDEASAEAYADTVHPAPAACDDAPACGCCFNPNSRAGAVL